MIDIRDKKKCCGCNACGDVCPKNAITFTTDNEGIWYPQVNSELCVNCGLCNKLCPIENIASLKKNDLPQSICYAAEHKNLEVIFDSTSGGLFSALADIMYAQGGYVGGAIFNEDLTVSQFISNDKHDLPKLRSSKYLQSNAEGFYKKVKKLLDSGEKVLVCGTPCQMSAMRAYLQKDYENLIIADFICLGINSPKVWRKYLDSFEVRYGSPAVYAKAKSKEYGWRNLTQKIILEDGREFFETKDTSKFTQGYIYTHMYTRPSCYDCQFKGFPRIADITLADFWGIEKYNQELEKNLGTSLVMVNSQKGQAYFEQVKKKIRCMEMPFESILHGNPALTKPLKFYGGDREAFFKDLDIMPFGDVIDKYSNFPTSKKQKVKNLIKKCLPAAKAIKRIICQTQCSPKALYQTFRYNKLKNLLHFTGIIFTPHCTVFMEKGASLEVDGLAVFGAKGHFQSSSLESRLYIGKGSKLSIMGDLNLMYGADIEVLPGGHLIFRGKKNLGSGSNIGLTVICGDKIDIGHDVMMGRHVTIRDNNGGHYMNRRGYKNTRPVTIGTKAWLCESCTVMLGVKMGDGAILGAKSVAMKNIPAHALAYGMPAEVVDTDVLWKY